MQGIEKKRSSLHESEKGVVARHEAGHAVVGTAIASLLPGHARVEVHHKPMETYFSRHMVAAEFAYFPSLLIQLFLFLFLLLL
jgi:hypothetical protein